MIDLVELADIYIMRENYASNMILVFCPDELDGQSCSHWDTDILITFC